MSDIEKLIGDESPLQVGQKINEIVDYKANKNLNNTGMITNCLLEVPQRIKYDLTDGTLTIKAGSVVIVPYGVEDLTAQYPKGSTFLNDNFKVADTQFADGKFFVWAELVGDATNSRMYDQNEIMFIDFTQNILQGEKEGRGYSGNTAPTLSEKWGLWYDTNANLIKLTLDTGATWAVNYSFPVMLTTNTTSGYTSVNQVFNGMGYIGSTVWVDKGVKGFIPNGRNTDGSLNNIEFTNNKLISHTFASSLTYIGVLPCLYMDFPTNSAIVFDGEIKGLDYIAVKQIGGTQPSGGWWYDVENNIWKYNGVISRWLPISSCDVTSGIVSNFQPKLPFNAADIQDVVRKTGDTMTGTLQISQSTNKPMQISSQTIDITSAPTSNQYSMIEFLDKNNKRIGIIGSVQDTNGKYGVYMQSGNSGAVMLRTDGSTPFVTALTPATGDNSTKIATTAFVHKNAPPVGCVISSASSSTPSGYLYCNGAAVSRTTYADLYKVIGTTYGTGDGSTTFNLPNYSGYKFATSNAVAVFGDGKSLGLNNGSKNIGLGNASSGVGTYANTNYFHVALGTNNYSTYTTDGAMGVSTSSSNSGLKGTISVASLKWYIKY